MASNIEIGKVYKINSDFYTVNSMTGFVKCLEYDTVEGHIKAVVDFGIGEPYAIYGAGLERLTTSEEEFAWRIEQ